MQEALILKLIILALAVTFVAVIIALVLSFNITQKLMKHNANLIGQVKESDEQKASTQQSLFQTEHELHKAEEELKNAQDIINNMIRQAHQADRTKLRETLRASPLPSLTRGARGWFLASASKSSLP